jgi:hypothetical protein
MIILKKNPNSSLDHVTQDLKKKKMTNFGHKKNQCNSIFII